MTRKDETVNTGGGAYIRGDVHIDSGDFIGRDQARDGGVLPWDLDSPEAEAARARYRRVMRERYNVIETHAFTALASDARVGSPKRPPLVGKGGVYIPLAFQMPTIRTLNLHEVLELESINPNRIKGVNLIRPENEPYLILIQSESALPLSKLNLAIIGDAGSGKTTVLHVIASALAAEDPEALVPELVQVLPDPRPIPVLLPLRLFEHACASEDSRYDRCPEDLLRFVDEWFARWCPTAELPPGFLAAHIQAGRAWFLLDALDEVPDPTHRQTVRNVIRDLASQLSETRLIVTARVAAYRSTRLGDPFTVVEVRDLDDQQRGEMVRAIYGGLALPDADRRAGDLVQRFARSEALRDLGRTPVMVWTAAVIHALRGELPESRAALYDAYVDILLKHSFKRTRYDTEAVDVLVEGEGWPLPDRRHYLTYAAFETHRMLEGQLVRRARPEADRHIVVGEDELVDRVLGPYFRDNLGCDAREARQRARAFLALMVERSGLLYETEEGYTLGDHLTMQEFLAGCYLGEHYQWEDPEGYAAFLREAVGRSWWREVFLLAAGFLAEKPGFAARQFLRQIAGQGEDPEEQLMALVLAVHSLLQLRVRRRRPTWYGQLVPHLTERLDSILRNEPMVVPVEARQEAGLMLGQLYGMPGDKMGVGDPRFPGPQGLPDFVQIPAGEFWMGSDDSGRDNERTQHRVALSAYEIARYPTTHAMYACFIADGGYADARWWAEAIEDGYWKEGAGYRYGNLPKYWDDDRWNNPSQPVVGVSWYEAVAYCRWLTAAVDDGYVYRLPTEAEWERAARGPEGWAYPWGDDWREGRCNSEEAGLAQTSPVGLFPEGVTLEGLHDMVGNVWEWCWDWYAAYAYAGSQHRNPTGPDSGQYRVLRGGSWYSDGPSRCRCGFRPGLYPWYGNYDRGFRCVRTLS